MRIVSNYVRMACTFAIGIYIMRRLLSIDPSLFAVYTLLTVGLGVGMMIREALRMALVPFLRQHIKPDGSITSSQFQQSLTLTTIFALANTSLYFFIAHMGSLFNISATYADQFKDFVFLRGIGYSFIIICVPFLNLLANEYRMISYNCWLLAERVLDVVVIETIIRALHDNSTQPLVSGGIAYLVCTFFLMCLLILIRKFTSREGISIKPKLITKTNYRYFLKRIRSSGLLVVTMAMYFRFSLVIINIVFGEALAISYAIAVQVSSYLRQITMGLITGLDSYFARKSADRTKNLMAKEVNKKALSSAIFLFLVFLTFIIFLRPLVQFLTQGSDINIESVLIFSTFFLCGVFIRATSETWMQFLSGLGKVNLYSTKVFCVAVISQAYVLILSQFSLNEPEYYIGAGFFAAMFVSHWLIVPIALKKANAD